MHFTDRAILRMRAGDTWADHLAARVGEERLAAFCLLAGVLLCGFLEGLLS